MGHKGYKNQVVAAGKLVDAEVVEVREATRPWTDFLLEDGTRLRVNVVILNCHRIEGEYDQRGNPKYLVNTQNVISATAPEELRRKVE